MALYPSSSKAPPAPGKTEFEILKASHKFLREEDDKGQPLSWDEQLASKYYDSLFREYAVYDLKHYKSGNVRPLPWWISKLLTSVTKSVFSAVENGGGGPGGGGRDDVREHAVRAPPLWRATAAAALDARAALHVRRGRRDQVRARQGRPVREVPREDDVEAPEGEGAAACGGWRCRERRGGRACPR